MNQVKNWIPFVVALILGIFGLTWYLYSGQDSFDRVTTGLTTDSTEIAEVNLGDPKRVTIKCKNGESYEIVFTENQQNYDELIFNKCGEQGSVENGVTS